ncbi:MAG: hypothetical protein N3F08_01240 [Crenarchaeota archaeon]|nr:hypothetical protein [Thermoproteota archaeon]
MKKEKSKPVLLRKPAASTVSPSSASRSRGFWKQWSGEYSFLFAGAGAGGVGQGREADYSSFRIRLYSDQDFEDVARLLMNMYNDAWAGRGVYSRQPPGTQVHRIPRTRGYETLNMLELAKHLDRIPEPYSDKTIEIEGHRLKLR